MVTLGQEAPIRIGVVFPQNELGADRAAVRSYAEAVQGLGYRHVMAYDHVVGADPAGHPGFAGTYTNADMFHEPFVLFGFLAGFVPELELVTGVIVLPQRQTVLVAKQAAQVDILTGGQFRLGVGLGWNRVEYQALGRDFGNRARRVTEQIELMRRLWVEPVLTFEGDDHTVIAAGLNPLPIQRPIPVWMGGATEPALKRIARIGDGFIPERDPPAGDWRSTLARMREWRAEAGRDEDGFGIDRRISVSSGSPDDWLRSAEEWRALGATHLTIDTTRGGLRGPEAHVERLVQAREILSSG